MQDSTLFGGMYSFIAMRAFFLLGIIIDVTVAVMVPIAVEVTIVVVVAVVPGASFLDFGLMRKEARMKCLQSSCWGSFCDSWIILIELIVINKTIVDLSKAIENLADHLCIAVLSFKICDILSIHL